MKMFDVLVIGAGVNGLATAYHLSKRSNLRIGIIEQFSFGNSYGGSHGSSRIIRSIYPNPTYIKLIQRARNEEWIELEKEAGNKLIHPNVSCYFGSGTTFEKYVQSITSTGLDVDLLDVFSAQRMYPQFRFQNTSTVLHDRTGGVIAAKETMAKFATLSIKNGVQLHENTKVLKIDSSKNPICITTNRGTVHTERLVITAGSWINQLLPELNPKVTAIRQRVAYFKLRGPKALYQIGLFPCWASIADGANQVFYGLPEFEGEGIKVAQHITVGNQDDPNEKLTMPDPKEIQVLADFVKDNFFQPIDSLIKSETCFYANTPNENFIIDLLPTDQRIAIGSICSGHGFKFAPLSGRLLSELILDGKTTIPEFEESRELFAISR